MSLDSIHTAQHDVEQLQSALSSVQTGLDAVETTARAAREARRRLRRIVKVVLVLAIIGVAVSIVKSKTSDRPNGSDEQT